MEQRQLTFHRAVTSPSQADSDSQLLALWLHGRSRHTQRAYAGGVRRFDEFTGKPLRAIRLQDLQDFADSLGDLRPRWRVQHALTSLTEQERALVEAIYYDGKSQRQLASDRGVQAPAISKQHKKALAKLRAVMDGTWCSSSSLKKLRLGGAPPARKPWETLRSLVRLTG
jgi:RNA polymerase sigma factor (sigma-70 family)